MQNIILSSKSYLLLCEEPLRAGASYTTAMYGAIDNPILRNPGDMLPIIEGGSYRGALRDTFSRKGISDQTIRLLFGNKPNDIEQQHGTIRLSKLNILFFPVVAPLGIQAYVTCPMALENWNSMQDISGDSTLTISGIPDEVTHSEVIATKNTYLSAPRDNKKVILIHDTFTKNTKTLDSCCTIEEGNPINEWFGEKLFAKYPVLKENFIHNLVIVSNDIFRIMVTHHTYIATGIAINPETKVVDSGKLFKTEYLPQFTVMQGSIWASPEFVASNGKNATQNMNEFTKSITNDLRGYVQIGGRSSIGKGISKIILLDSSKHRKTMEM